MTQHQHAEHAESAAVPDAAEPDFAAERSRPTCADEQAGEVNTRPDESAPRGGDMGSDGMDIGSDMDNPPPVEPPD